MAESVFVSLTTDFGAAYTGVMAGVVARIAPEARVQVLSDEVTPYAVVEGATLLAQALPYLPVGVHVGVVDPGVGTDRLPVGVLTGRGDFLVGPDNGLLAHAAEALGGVVDARVLAEPRLRLKETSSTFHGRDVFAPAAAHLARGVPLTEFGPPASLLPLHTPKPYTSDGFLSATVLYADAFGSLVLGARPSDLVDAFGLLPYGTVLDFEGHPTPWVKTYGDVPVGSPLLFQDSSGFLALGVNQGSAAREFAVQAGAHVSLHARA
ncbi:S-adenosyl-l-methionine hydroxide adenosyltransferase family protein [Actinocorallia sp. A-T 12471]|uniref:SAM hydrolase/SAM-dependent halogenase family protein n=1 Tax=Actinocorallia sp. A-T 12471 TaxID=3089813 RepID=UPI0029D083C6|nr:SAM-dependent chlorinase/fluorinase [Actinocorallia sp. A-T 12471]MDX6744717.1 SAM-dependent chlorinase/fluorinase [Actinocorallia sp. A-T 12471]